jgi:hypothetical protein
MKLHGQLALSGLLLSACSGAPPAKMPPPPVMMQPGTPSFYVELDPGPKSPANLTWAAVVGDVDGTPFSLDLSGLVGKPVLVPTIDLSHAKQARAVAFAATTDETQLAQAAATLALSAHDETLKLTLGDDVVTDPPLAGPTPVGANGALITVDQPMIKPVASADTPDTRTVIISNVGTAATTLATTLLSPAQNQISLSGCGAGVLQPGTSCALGITLTPTGTSGSIVGGIAVDGGEGGLETIVIDGTVVGVASLSFAAASEGEFGSLLPGKSTAPQTITVDNAGATATTALSLAVSGADKGSFTFAGDGCSGASVGGGRSCSISIVFTPTHDGDHNATLTVSGTKGGTATLALHGIQAVPLTMSADVHGDFGPITKGLDGYKAFTITNNGSVATGTLTVRLAGDPSFTFSIGSPLCGGSLGAGATCPITIQAAGEQDGARTGTLVVSAIPGGTLSIPLSSTVADSFIALDVDGVPMPTVPEPLVVLPSVPTNPNATITHTLNIHNVSQTPVPVRGASPPTTCQAMLAPGASCTQTISFDAWSYGAVTNKYTQLEIAGSWVPRVEIWYSALQTSVATVLVSKGDQTVTVTNVGAATVNAPTGSIDNGVGDPRFSITSTTCSGTLAPNATCNFVVHDSTPGVVGSLTISSPTEGTFNVGLN